MKQAIQEKKIICLPETSPSAWNEALRGLPNPHPLQSWGWGAFKSRWGWTAFPYLFYHQEEEGKGSPLAAAMVLSRGVPGLPYTILYVPKGPCLNYEETGVREGILAQLERLGREHRAIFIKIDPDVIRGFGAEEFKPEAGGLMFTGELETRGWRFSDDQIQFRNTVELDLTLSEADLLAAMKQKTRYNIRLAGRKGINIRLGNSVDFETIVRMYMETAIRDGFTVRPEAYYLDAWSTFYKANMAQPFLAEFDGRPVAAIIIVRMGHRAIYMYGASTNEERQRMPNHLLQWEAIRWAREQGCTIYDFWGAPDDFIESDPLWGVWRFKAGFNGQVVRHIGAWDFPVRPFWYKTYHTLMPKYMDLLRSRNNKRNKS